MLSQTVSQNYSLAHLHEYDNETQLRLLYEELSHLPTSTNSVNPKPTVNPSREWYQARFPAVKSYANLNWSSLSKRFEGRDPYLHETPKLIHALANQLVDEYATHPYFDLTSYVQLIVEVTHIWSYYRDNYDQEQEEYENLLEAMDECILGT